MRDERISRREDLLSIDNSRLGCDKGSQQSLDAALPAPEGGVVGLWHHGTMLPQKLVELFTSRDELWFLQKSTWGNRLSTKSGIKTIRKNILSSFPALNDGWLQSQKETFDRGTISALFMTDLSYLKVISSFSLIRCQYTCVLTRFH